MFSLIGLLRKANVQAGLRLMSFRKDGKIKIKTSCGEGKGSHMGQCFLNLECVTQ